MSMRKQSLAAITVIVILTILFTATACSRIVGDPSTPPSHILQDDASEGPLERVPDLRGYTLEVLMHEFENLGFTPSIIMIISDEPLDTILSIGQMNQLVPISTTIDVTVSAGSPDWESDEVTAADETMPEQQEYRRLEFGGFSWLVLEEEDDKLMLLSEYILFDQRYHNLNEAVTWETSSLRRYLNNEFFNSFTLEDRQRIAEARVINDERQVHFPFELGLGMPRSWSVPAGNDTYDRIFLLSFDEQRNYFADASARLAGMIDDHPGRGGLYTHWWWWLRSPGVCTFSVGVITTRGVDNVAVESTQAVGVRPVLWMYLDYH